MGTFLSQIFNSSGGELAMAYETQSIGAIIAPFIIGLIADRYFAAQKILGLLHLLGAALLFIVVMQIIFLLSILIFLFTCYCICLLWH